MNSLTIKTHSESRREYEFFQAILTLAGSVLTHDWRVVESDPADVVLISFDAAERHSAWEAYAQKYPVDRLIAYTDKAEIKGAKWHIQRAPESMPRLSEVVKVLNSAAQYFETAGEAPDRVPPAPTPSPAEAVGRFHPERHLAGVIQQALDDGACRMCDMPGGALVYVCPKDNIVYTAASPSELSALCRADIAALRVEAMTEEALREAVAAQAPLKRRTLAEFLWFALLTGSNGRLLDGCAMDEPLHLREWPGHVRLPFYAMYHDIATQMAGGWASLAEIAEKSAAPVQNAIDLHNACAYLGFIARGEAGRALARQKTEARERLRALMRPHCEEEDGHVKLVVVGSVGSVGAGKTTALTTLSETPPILTEASPSDAVAGRKPTTTIAMEYGEIFVRPDAKLQIYGTPGQRRFDFMGEILCGRAWGVLILIDNTEPDPLAELDYYLGLYAGKLALPNIAVGVSHYDDRQDPPLAAYRQRLSERGHAFPVAAADPRDIQSLEALVAAMAESRAEALSYA
jgi:hypothetical protein